MPWGQNILSGRKGRKNRVRRSTGCLKNCRCESCYAVGRPLFSRRARSGGRGDKERFCEQCRSTAASPAATRPSTRTDAEVANAPPATGRLCGVRLIPTGSLLDSRCPIRDAAGRQQPPAVSLRERLLMSARMLCRAPVGLNLQPGNESHRYLDEYGKKRPCHGANGPEYRISHPCRNPTDRAMLICLNQGNNYTMKPQAC